MGLDQGLFKRKKGRGKPVREELVYWRKANQIHNWMLNNVVPEEKREDFNCDYAEISKEQLEELKKTCEIVAKKCKLIPSKIVKVNVLTKDGIKQKRQFSKKVINKKVAEKYLPTMEGFFFGGTEYDDYYIADVKHTIEEIDKVLKETDFDKYIVEYNCWW